MMKLSEVEKAAVLLIALGPARAQRILDRLGPADLMPIVGAMKRMGAVSPEVRRAVLKEVQGLLTGEAPEGERAGEPRRPAGPAPGLFGRMRSLFPGGIDWRAAGFDFGAEEEDRRRPPEEEG